jgi:hypothetical protein
MILSNYLLNIYIYWKHVETHNTTYYIFPTGRSGGSIGAEGAAGADLR